jgi:hypothetical protein
MKIQALTAKCSRTPGAQARVSFVSCALVLACAMPFAAAAQDSASLAQAAQNPIADMISVPFQNNVNFNVGPEENTQNILNIQPVMPFNLNADWNLVTRTILPVIHQPSFGPGQGSEFGLGDIQFSAFLSPSKPAGGWVWGAGAIAQLDTATDDRLGQGAWGLGPSAVALKIGKTWVYGALINNVWSVSKDSGRPDVNQMLIQPFVNYNFANHPGRYLSFAPIITANWEASSGQKWVIPLGLGIGQIMRWGKQPVNLQVAGYYNVEHPDNAADWQLRVQVQFLFPK